MSEEILYIDDGGLVYYINENEFITCDEIPYPMLEGIKHLQQKVEQLEKEKNTLMYSLTLVRQKWNNDKARYRRKAKVYREQRNQLEKENQKLKEDNIFLKTNLTKLSSKYIKNDLLNILNKGSEK